MKTDRLRFETPLYTVAEAARIVDVPSRTLRDWAKGYLHRFPDRPDVTGGPVITFDPPSRYGEPSIPFIGLAEALVLAAVRRSGVRAFGAPIFERGGARVEDVLERFWADESMDELADEFGVPVDQLRDILRVASRRAA